MEERLHKPVMVAEVLAGLAPKAGGQFADGTLGSGRLAARILAATSPNGWLFGCDRDADAVEVARRELAGFAGRFEVRQGNFADMPEWIPAGSCDGVALDLGISSMQLETAERGFSFQRDGPLDMRMDRRQAITAEDLVNTCDREELARIFREFGGEPQARRLAGALIRERTRRRISRTGQLAELVAKVAPRRGKKAHPATRVFQALRVAVNNELESLRRGLDGALRILKPGGRLVVITFHSLEDRMVKEFGQERARAYTYPGEVDIPELRVPKTPELKLLGRKAMVPGEAELRENPRSRSAHLRVMQKARN